MSAEENTAIVLRSFLESHNAPYHLDVMDDTGLPASAADHKQWQRMERQAFPDKHFIVEDVVAEDDKVVLRWTIRGTHLGAFWTPVGTAAPTGKAFTLTSTVISRVAAGQSAEEWACHDWLRVVQQFGAELRLPERP